LADWCLLNGLFREKVSQNHNIVVINPYTKRETEVNALPTVHLSKPENLYENCLIKFAAKSLNQSWMMPWQLQPRDSYSRTNFPCPENLRNTGARQRPLHMFCRPRESIRPSSSWKDLENVAWVQCRLILAVWSLHS